MWLKNGGRRKVRYAVWLETGDGGDRSINRVSTVQISDFLTITLKRFSDYGSRVSRSRPLPSPLLRVRG